MPRVTGHVLASPRRTLVAEGVREHQAQARVDIARSTSTAGVFANPLGSLVHPAAVYDNGTRRNTDRGSGGGCC
jgi:hypothetical protein